MATTPRLAVGGPILRRNGAAESRHHEGTPLTVERQPLPVRRIVLDISLGILCFVLELVMRVVKPVQRGFFCDDLEIRYPFLESTISAKALFIYVFTLPALIIFFVEFVRFTLPKTRHERYSIYEHGREGLRRFSVRFFSLYGYTLLGISITMAVNTLAKFCVGRLRPHFLAVCRPTNIDLTTCDGVRNVYITGVQCDWLHPSALVESRLSFFSGHSSLSMCAAVYSVVYLQYRAWPLMRPHASRAPLAVLQFVIISTASFIGYSRIFDYWHHWSDVLCGMIVGATIGLLTGLFLILPRNRSRKTIGEAGGFAVGLNEDIDADDESDSQEARPAAVTRVQAGHANQHFV